MEPVAQDNNTIFTLKRDDQTFVAPYSTDNGNKSNAKIISKILFSYPKYV